MAPAFTPDWPWLDFLDHLEARHGATLSVWELDFVDSLRDQLERTRTVSKKQEAVLSRLRQRCDHSPPP